MAAGGDASGAAWERLRLRLKNSKKTLMRFARDSEGLSFLTAPQAELAVMKFLGGFQRGILFKESPFGRRRQIRRD
jgi:hypothetical protein